MVATIPMRLRRSRGAGWEGHLGRNAVTTRADNALAGWLLVVADHDDVPGTGLKVGSPAPGPPGT